MSSLFSTSISPEVAARAPAVRPRPYQGDAFDAVFEQWKTASSTLVVHPTGSGKTTLFALIIRRFHEMYPDKRVLVLAHRMELIGQAAERIHLITGEEVEIEMAEQWANHGLHGQKVIVSSIQSQNSGMGGKGRMSRFSPHDFGLLIVDEAHHAPAESYQTVIDYYRQNPDLKVLGVTATPDRADEEALGQIFQTVAHVYEINDAIHDGWLAPIRQMAVTVEGLDFSMMRTTAGDLNGADLAAVMESEQMLHGIADPTVKIAGDRPTLVFAASLNHAETLCEIFNRHREHSAQWVHGGTPKWDRRMIFKNYSAGKFQFLINVGVVTEGVDIPSCQVVAIGRPTKSRALYSQMVGRGLRPLPGLIDHLDTAEERCAAIVGSAKPFCEVIDFVGNSGRHKLVTAADILGGNYPDDVIDRANKDIEEAGRQGLNADTEEALEKANRDIHKEKEEDRKRREAEQAKRKHVIGQARYSTTSINPFDVFEIQPQREPGWHRGRRPTPGQIKCLEGMGVKVDEKLSFVHASQLIDNLFKRRKADLCSWKQARILNKYNINPENVGFKEASQLIDKIAANGWKPIPLDDGRDAYV